MGSWPLASSRRGCAVNVGDIVVCRGSRGYAFTTGKQYTVLLYEPEAHDPTYTWPAYVSVLDDHGDTVFCHADRFEKP